MAEFGVYLNGLGGNYREAKELWIAIDHRYLAEVDTLILKDVDQRLKIPLVFLPSFN